MPNNATFLGMIDQPCMIARLSDGLREALREFREDPTAFVRTALKRDGFGSRRSMLLQVGLAIAIVFYAIAFVSMLVFWSFAQHRSPGSNDNSQIVILKLPSYPPKIDVPNGDDKSGGGGGGGNQTKNPPSSGDIPISSLAMLVMAPTPEPQLKPPVLPMIEKVSVDHVFSSSTMI